MTSIVPTNIIDTVRHMDGSRRFISIGGLAAALIVIWLLVKWATEPTWAALFPDSLSLTEASRIVEQLEASGVPYELRGGGSEIVVPASDVERLRMTFAAQELGIGSCGQGLDFPLGAGNLQQQMMRSQSIQDHLECTISGMAGIDRAQVHLTLPEQTPFRRLRAPPKASVVIWPSGGARITREGVEGITYLVSSAVDGLGSDEVAVINANGGTPLFLPNRKGSVTASSSQELHIRGDVEQHLANKIETMLGPLLSPGEFQVSVTAELDFTEISRTSEQFDPEGQAIVREGTSQVPAGATGPGSPPFSSEERESRYSRTVENMTMSPGGIERLSVAVLVNERAEVLAGPPGGPAISPAARVNQLARIDSLARNAVGIDSTRGDRLVVTAIPFLSLGDSTFVAEENTTVATSLRVAERLFRPVIGLVAVVLVALLSWRVLHPVVLGSVSALPRASDRAGQPTAPLHEAPRPPAQLDASTRLQNAVIRDTDDNPETAARVIKAWLQEA